MLYKTLNKLFLIFFLLALAHTPRANAHLFLKSPTPMQGNVIKDPLEADGSNFPCHGVSLASAGTGVSWAAGSSQQLVFDDGNGANTATHGGGSCQLSLTYETDASKVKDPKNWFVIHSIEGGCPALTYGNLENQTTYTPHDQALQCSGQGNVDCLQQFNFTIPKGVKAGKAIFSWTWFNTIGNQEIYQNCLPVDISGGDGSDMSSFPTMFLANLPDAGCFSERLGNQWQNLKFPFPGNSVDRPQPFGLGASQFQPYPLLISGNGTGCATNGQPASNAPSSVAPSGYASASSGSPSSSASAAMSAGSNDPITVTTLATVTAGGPAAIATGSASATDDGMSMDLSPSSTAPAVVASSSPAAVSSSYAAASTGASETGNTSGSGLSSGTTGSTSGGSCAAPAVTCSNAGAVVCISSTQFGLCNNGCAVPQAVAAGTQCTGGQISALSGRGLSRVMRRQYDLHLGPDGEIYRTDGEDTHTNINGEAIADCSVDRGNCGY